MRIGTIDIDMPITLAPMEDVTDTAFRLICKRQGADIVYTEFASSEALIRGIPRVINKIRITAEERPIGIQIFGGVEQSMGAAAKKVESFQPDLIDINCGCWVKNHVTRGEGAALLKDLPLFEKIVSSTVKATRLPVTVKTRLGWDAENIVILDVARIVEQAGAKALTVHCRTRSQAHRGRADWHWLERIKKAVSIPIIGNGDIVVPEDVHRMFQTGCDGVMIGRGAVANPWIFAQAKHYLKTKQLLPDPSIVDRINLCLEHLKLSVQFKGPRHGVISFRKYYSGYLKGLPHANNLKADLMTMVEIDKINSLLRRFAESFHPTTVG